MSNHSETVTLLGPWPPPAGGVATHLTSLRGFLQRSGYRTRVLAESRHATGPAIHRMDPRRRSLPKLGLLLATIPEAGGILHCHGSLISFPALSTMTVFRTAIYARRIRWIETLHDQTLLERFPTWPIGRQRLFEESLRQAEHVLAVGSDLAEFASSIGVDSTRLTRSSPLISADLELGDLPATVGEFAGSHSPLIVGVGAPTPEYDFQSFLTAFEVFHSRHRQAGLVLASTSFADDPAYSGGIESLLRRLGSDVLYVTDLDRPVLLRLVSRADVVLRGPIAESFGLVRAEAALLRTPVIGTRTGSDLFTVGYLHGDVESLLQAIVDVLECRSFPDQERALVHYRKLAEATQMDVLRAYRDARLQ